MFWVSGWTIYLRTCLLDLRNAEAYLQEGLQVSARFAVSSKIHDDTCSGLCEELEENTR